MSTRQEAGARQGQRRGGSGEGAKSAHFVDAVGTRLDGSPLAVMLDIDGTLAPIAPTPQAARIPADTRDVLRRLVALAPPNVVLALVSGRSADDAWQLAGIEGAWVIGNHGLELRTPEGQLSVNADVRPHEATVREAARLLSSLERAAPGSIVENKRWTLSVHYRLVQPDSVTAVIAQAREVANALGLRVMEGRKIVELRPPVRVDKGTACVAFAERAGALRGGASAMYAGDDRTDEDAFRELRARSVPAVTVRIIGAGDRLDARTAAEFVLESPDELRRALEWLVARRERAVTV